MAAPIRVLSVDDHAVVREGIEAILNREGDIEVVGSVATGEDAVALFRSCSPDITLMDLHLPAMSGIEAIRTLRRLNSRARIIVLTVHHGDEDILRAFEAGAAHYLRKETLTDDLVRAVREVHAGRTPLEEQANAARHMNAGHGRLTSREVEVITLVSQGMRNKEIATLLGIAEVTVQVHIKNVFTKLGVNGRTAAVNVALHRGIIHTTM